MLTYRKGQIIPPGQEEWYAGVTRRRRFTAALCLAAFAVGAFIGLRMAVNEFWGTGRGQLTYVLYPLFQGFLFLGLCALPIGLAHMIRYEIHKHRENKKLFKGLLPYSTNIEHPLVAAELEHADLVREVVADARDTYHQAIQDAYDAGDLEAVQRLFDQAASEGLAVNAVTFREWRTLRERGQI